jgi:tRNA dimethylallyltransferase
MRSKPWHSPYLCQVKKLIVLVGPTAAGKTAAAIALAQKLGTEIISADSRQVFKELSIGTAKPTAEELNSAQHHFIGNKSIHDDYDAGQYGDEALALIEQLFKKYDTLVMVGGSGLYIKAALEGFDDMPEIPEGLREAIHEEYRQKGLAWLQQEVEKADPDYFAIVDQLNPHRLLRALELLRTSSQPIHSLRQNKKKALSFEVVKIGLNPPREELYRRIDTRMDKMIKAGLFDEARQFYSLRNLNALQTVGYREIFDFIDGLYDYDEAVRLLKRNSRRYAKRQLTWFQKDQATQWFENENQIVAFATKL